MGLFLLNLPAFVKVFLSFAGILLVYRLTRSIGIGLCLFSVALALWTGTGTEGFAYLAALFIQPENYLLISVIALLLFFSEALNASGRISVTVAALKNWLKSDGLLFAGLPAIVGLLPMPGGALFSAPLVESVDEHGRIPPAHKVAINYWFRHIWEYWWPLYPGVILAMQFADLPMGTYLLIQSPMPAVALGAGWFFILRPLRAFRGGNARAADGVLDLTAVSRAFVPILLLVMTAVGGSIGLAASGVDRTLANLVAMNVGLVLVVPVIFAGARQSLPRALKLFTSKRFWSLTLVVVGVQLFSGALRIPLDGAEATLVHRMRDECMAVGIPLIPIMMLIPFVSGLVTGIAVGFVGSSFPLLFALLGSEPSFGVVAATVMIAYTFGYMGMMLSPVHICFVVSGEFFKSTLYRAYPYLVGPAVTILAAGSLLAAAYFTLL